jgi:molecular chaperone HscB
MSLNYYELYQITEPLEIDKVALRQRFMALSKQYHPDRTITASEEEQTHALQQMEIVNVAYKILQDESKNLEYYLQLKRIISTDEAYALPNTFLMETMDLNEAIMDAKLEQNSVALNNISTNIQSEIDEHTAKLKHNLLVEQNTSLAKELFYKLKYYKRALALAQNINVEL